MSSFAARLREGTSTVFSYFRGVIGELRMIRWPSRTELLNYTVTVVVVCAVIFILTFGFDLLVTEGFRALGIGSQ